MKLGHDQNDPWLFVTLPLCLLLTFPLMRVAFWLQEIILIIWWCGLDAYFQEHVRVATHKPLVLTNGESPAGFVDFITGMPLGIGSLFLSYFLAYSFCLLLQLVVKERPTKMTGSANPGELRYFESFTIHVQPMSKPRDRD